MRRQNKAMHAYMPLSLKFSPDIFEWLMARVSEEKMDVPTHPERFSPRQIVCRLAFWGPVARWRMKRALEEDGAAVEGWDEDGHCIEANYDGQYLAEMLAEVVENMGYTSRVVGTGEAALDVLAEKIPDFVLLDWILPGIQGIAVLNTIRTVLNLKVPVLMLTAKGDIDARVEGLEGGADDYMAKPVHMQELQARILAVMRRKEKLTQEDGPADASG